MKTSARTPSATSLPRAPRDEARSRVTKYMVMMGISILCFGLMVLVTPYGWYTWVFAAGAVFLPYIAVVIANVGDDVVDTAAESPERTLLSPDAPVAAPEPAPDAPTVIRIQESPSPPEQR